MSLDQKLAEPTFGQKILSQFKEVGHAYGQLVRHPKRIPLGVYHVLKDTFYELPKQIITHQEEPDKTKALETKVSQALAISEVVGIGGTFAGVNLFKQLGADDYTATIVGGIAGNYLSAVVSFLGSYLGLSRSVRDYSLGEATIDCLKMARNVLPTAIAVYASEAPLQAGLLALGLSPNAATTINTILGTALFTGAAKSVSDQELKN